MTCIDNTEVREAAGVAAELCHAVQTRDVATITATVESLFAWDEADRGERVAVVLAAILNAVVERRTAFASTDDLCDWLRSISEGAAR